MKRIISLFVALIALSSCTISEGWNSDRDLVAKMAANLALDEIREQTHILSYAQIVDLYSRSGDGERETIEDQHLPNVRLRQTETGWNVVRDGKIALSFEFTTPLDTLGSIWTVKVATDKQQITADQYWTIECKGKKQWQLSRHVIETSRSTTSTFDVEAGDQIGGQVQSGPVYQYTITGECSIVQDEEIVAPYRIYMKIVDEVVFDNFKYYSNYTGTAFTEGKMSIRVNNYKTGEAVVAPFHFTIAAEYSNQKIEYLLYADQK